MNTKSIVAMTANIHYCARGKRKQISAITFFRLFLFFVFFSFNPLPHSFKHRRYTNTHIVQSPAHRFINEWIRWIVNYFPKTYSHLNRTQFDFHFVYSRNGWLLRKQTSRYVCTKTNRINFPIFNLFPYTDYMLPLFQYWRIEIYDANEEKRRKKTIRINKTQAESIGPRIHNVEKA